MTGKDVVVVIVEIVLQWVDLLSAIVVETSLVSFGHPYYPLIAMVEYSIWEGTHLAVRARAGVAAARAALALAGGHGGRWGV